MLESNLDNLPDNMKAAYKMLKAGFQNNKVNIDKTLIDGQELPYCGGMYNGNVNKRIVEFAKGD